MRNVNQIVVFTALLGIVQMFLCSSVSSNDHLYRAARAEKPLT
jgi:hypothetical protein